MVGRSVVAFLLLMAACAHDTTAPPAAAPGVLHVTVTDAANGQPMPCKLILSTSDPMRRPHFGMGGMVGDWIGPNVLATEDAIYGDPCDADIELPSGDYHVQASRGIEFEIAQQDVTVKPHGHTQLELSLTRALDTTGYACADFHVHSAPSFDSDVPLDQRLISAVAEGLDAMAPTDHDVLGDWDGELARTNMADQLTLVLGNEVTPDQWSTPQAIGHFGVFPIPTNFDPQDYELTWQSPAGLLERLDTLYPDSLIQVNHPRWDPIIGYFSAAGFNPLDTHIDDRLGLSHLDAIELWNSHEIDVTGGTPLEVLLQDYFALLDLGVVLVATGNTDTHELSRQPLGYPRNCIKVADDDHPGLTPEMITDGVSRGQVFVTSGPWLEVSLDGHGPGERAMRSDAPMLDVSIDAASWVPVERLQVIVNGTTVESRPVQSLPAHFQIPLQLPDAVSYIMVIVDAMAPLPNVGGTLQNQQRSAAFSNPIWVQAP
ncbi:MAG TPA: CehA/McbA family metallohydrolase [Polyangiales bacterium]|nr:CehA/McbA family metallohydrolase [Polyangiales bacterium]